MEKQLNLRTGVVIPEDKVIIITTRLNLNDPSLGTWLRGYSHKRILRNATTEGLNVIVGRSSYGELANSGKK